MPCRGSVGQESGTRHQFLSLPAAGTTAGDINARPGQQGGFLFYIESYFQDGIPAVTVGNLLLSMLPSGSQESFRRYAGVYAALWVGGVGRLALGQSPTWADLHKPGRRTRPRSRKSSLRIGFPYTDAEEKRWGHWEFDIFGIFVESLNVTL